MRLLYIGDIMGEPGVNIAARLLPELRSSKKIDVVVAQAENVTNGRGISAEDYLSLKQLGIDFFTGGNWSLNQPDIITYLDDPNEPIIRPANYPISTAGLGFKYLTTKKGQILFISLLGKIVGRDADQDLINPLKMVDEILNNERHHQKIGTLVNFHGDYSSEKVVIGHYLDGRVSAVMGDHWHVPTADARILPKGTAHMSDVGMCGILNASLGVKLPIIINRWRDDFKAKNELETAGPSQFNAAIIDIDEETGRSTSISHYRKIV